MAKDAAISLAEERLETINMLNMENKKMREEYEDILEIKVLAVQIQEQKLSISLALLQDVNNQLLRSITWRCRSSGSTLSPFFAE